MTGVETLTHSENDGLFKGKYHIDATRLRGWDYSRDGYYFVTIRVKDRAHALKQIKNGEVFIK